MLVSGGALPALMSASSWRSRSASAFARRSAWREARSAARVSPCGGCVSTWAGAGAGAAGAGAGAAAGAAAGAGAGAAAGAAAGSVCPAFGSSCGSVCWWSSSPSSFKSLSNCFRISRSPLSNCAVVITTPVVYGRSPRLSPPSKRTTPTAWTRGPRVAATAYTPIPVGLNRRLETKKPTQGGLVNEVGEGATRWLRAAPP
ncbi:hypothetical protein RD110_15605 [Rhodoferax koreense]|uniref:Uncharacterized protein n=1 Tax=Rhodoferax koreensis TaxID=1842727 RepID=A0A1P8JXI2_9BURK|nr:hypothetical protein RD110_15605 [Rhodoferax koreense]